MGWILCVLEQWLQVLPEMDWTCTNRRTWWRKELYELKYLMFQKFTLILCCDELSEQWINWFNIEYGKFCHNRSLFCHFCIVHIFNVASLSTFYHMKSLMYFFNSSQLFSAEFDSHRKPLTVTSLTAKIGEDKKPDSQVCTRGNPASYPLLF